MTARSHYDVLLVDDDASDIRIITEAMKSHSLVRLHTVSDGEAAMQWLAKTSENKSIRRPNLILLDLNLPRKNGLEVLREIRASQFLRSIPVIVLTTSHSEKDILDAYLCNANAVITKPNDFNGFVSLISEINKFWLSVANLPNNKDLFAT